MPMYLYRCACGVEKRESNTIANRRASPDCHGPMKLIIEAPQVQAQILGGSQTPGYLCPVTGEYVTSRVRRREIMKEHNLDEAGDSSRAQRERQEQLNDLTKGTGVRN